MVPDQQVPNPLVFQRGDGYHGNHSGLPSVPREIPGRQDINKALDYIHGQYRENISVTDLAGMCLLSLRHFERRFKSYFNLSPSQYILKMGVHEACDQLCNISRPIGDIDFAPDFYDQSSFTVQFKKTMSMTPLQYGKQFL